MTGDVAPGEEGEHGQRRDGGGAGGAALGEGAVGFLVVAEPDEGLVDGVTDLCRDWFFLNVGARDW
jgi:hypothetical protein